MVKRVAGQEPKRRADFICRQQANLGESALRDHCQKLQSCTIPSPTTPTPKTRRARFRNKLRDPQDEQGFLLHA